MTTIVNSGSIGTTVTLNAGDYLSNAATGLITGYPAVYGIGGPSTLANLGTIEGDTGGPAQLFFAADGGTAVAVAEGGSITNSGVVVGGLGGFEGALAHGGYGGTGVVLDAAGSITNSGGIYGGAGGGYSGRGGIGVYVSPLASATNYGVIVGGAGGSGSNLTIQRDAGGAGGLGVEMLGGGRFDNAGRIFGGAGAGGGHSRGSSAIAGPGGDGGAGVAISYSGTLQNTGGIYGGAGGFYFGFGAGGFYFADVGITGAGVLVSYGGGVTNGDAVHRGAVIEGGIGVVAYGGGATVINYGTIASGYGAGGKAVDFAHSGNTLVLEAGGTFSGGVQGGGGTLELGGGGGPGTLTGLGAQYVGFGSVSVDAGAAWTLTGNNTIADGTSLTRIIHEFDVGVA